jgi:4-hydroxy-tetrahydrodipicolinate reductase
MAERNRFNHIFAHKENEMHAPLKIGLLGYGRMGQMIEQLAPAQGAEVVWKINSSNRDHLDADLLKSADCVIEMTRPDAALQNVLLCLKHGVPVVTGTTGWQNELPVAHLHCHEHGGSMLYASNFSVGVNLFFAFNEYIAQRMAALDMYSAELEEWHHIHKKDAPSGTAVTIAEGIIRKNHQYQTWQLATNDHPFDEHTLPIAAHRQGEIIGTHTVLWRSAVDEIQIKHQANSREGFALGALLAARYIRDKQGVFTMQDVLGIS